MISQLIGRLMMLRLSILLTEFPLESFQDEHQHKCEDGRHEHNREEILEIPADDYVIHTKPVLFQDA